MPRILLALMIAVGLCAPIAGAPGTASAQVWKLKKAKTGTTAKAPAKKTKKSSARSSVKKKKRAAAKPRKVDLVPDEAEVEADAAARDRERDRAMDEADEPIIIQVEEL